MSTKFARRAIRDHALGTKIVSIDPAPRANIDTICDEVICSPVEDVDLTIFDQLKPGDVLFVDNSHFVSQNSDAVVMLVDILPRLEGNMLVHFHDIFWPSDYPPSTLGFMGEQYILAGYLLAGSQHVRPALANAYVQQDPELAADFSPIWHELRLAEKIYGGVSSFWIVNQS